MKYIIILLLVSLSEGQIQECVKQGQTACKNLPYSNAKERQNKALCEIGGYVDCIDKLQKKTK